MLLTVHQFKTKKFLTYMLTRCFRCWPLPPWNFFDRFLHLSTPEIWVFNSFNTYQLLSRPYNPPPLNFGLQHIWVYLIHTFSRLGLVADPIIQGIERPEFECSLRTAVLLEVASAIVVVASSPGWTPNPSWGMGWSWGRCACRMGGTSQTKLQPA